MNDAQINTRLARQMLKDAAEVLSNNSCNDWFFPEWMDELDREEFLTQYRHFYKDKHLPLLDWLVAKFLAARLGTEE